MNELQVALAIIGILAVIGILIYNRLQERRFRKQTEAGFAKPGRDVLLDGEPDKGAVNRAWDNQGEPVFNENDLALESIESAREPTFGEEISSFHEPQGGVKIEVDVAGSNAPPAAPVAPAHPVSQPVSPPVSGLAETAPDAQAFHKEAPHSELIEFRAQLKSVDGMASEAFGEAFNRCRALGKPVRWRALPLGGLDWEVLQPHSKKRYLEVVASMQLADRNGAAAKEELSALCNLAQEAAQAHGWQIKCDDLVEAMARAQSLDKFCADVDVLIGLNIISRGAAFLPIAKIRQEVEAAGMQLLADGAYHLLDSRNESLFTLTNREQKPFAADALGAPETKGITLLFDVPRVPDGLKTFDSMVALGRKLGHEAGGLLVDDNLRPLTDVGIEKIRTQLAQIYNKMESRGIPPGGRLALRLFS